MLKMRMGEMQSYWLLKVKRQQECDWLTETMAESDWFNSKCEALQSADAPFVHQSERSSKILDEDAPL